MLNILRLIKLSFLFMLFSHFALAADEKVRFGMAQIEIAGKTLEVEYAKTWQQRQQGLMHRTALCADCGMLFQFAQAQIASMWMKNTLIPLDVAYIQADGVIVDIKAMQPKDLTPVPSSKKVLFALEMNQGWFSQHQVKVGQKVSLISKQNE